MLSKSDYPLADAIAKFAALGTEAAFLVPTETGIEKSIMDAHGGIRDFLTRHGLHDFTSQLQGPANKVQIPIQVVSSSGLIERQISLYRPQTKMGDPRIWISGLRDFVKPWNLLALFTDAAGALFAVNCSDPQVFGAVTPSAAAKESRLEAALAREALPTDWDSVTHTLQADSEKSPLVRLLSRPAASLGVAGELLGLLRGVASQGWVQSMRAGDTGVGFTLETLLGISANSNRAPDYHGIEIKAGRLSKSTSARQTLFSKTPDWKNSAMSASEVLRNFGYQDDDGRLALYVTVRHVPNPQGLYLFVDESNTMLENYAKIAGSATPVRVTQWPFEALKQSLVEKHSETFWVHAERRQVDDIEQFRYISATHTRGPLLGNLAPLINLGKVTLDYTMHLKDTGGVRDHGYLFRMLRGDLPLLFPAALEHDLQART